MKATNRFLLTALAGITLVAATQAQAATITALGFENTTAGAWRSTDVAKDAAFDPNGDNAYGSDGYYVGAGGVDAVTPGVLQSNPAYISAISTGGSFYSGGGYIGIDDPTQPIGAAVADVQSGLYYGAGIKFSFTVSADTEFILTLIIGGQQGTNTPPNKITITDGSGSDSLSGLGTNVGTYAFFNIDAAAGDTFDVVIETGPGQGLTGIAFESAVPEPGSLALMGLGGLCLLRRRRNGS